MIAQNLELPLFGTHPVAAFKTQLLKWIGNKQKFAPAIVAFFPMDYGTYFEPFLGSGGVMASLAPRRGIGSDCFKPLMEIWHALKDSPDTLKGWYEERWNKLAVLGKKEAFEEIKRDYNKHPNGADLLFICRACYGGVVRFRQKDGHISTPCGIHDPIAPASFARRVEIWRLRLTGTSFEHMGYETALEMAKRGDLVYCDPPYSHTQAILYGAQSFSLEDLFTRIARCKMRGVRVALSIDGTKKSGKLNCPLPIPEGLFEQQVFIDCGRSMLKRFQMTGRSLEQECIADRLLLTY